MTVRLLTGDCRSVLATLPDASVQCCVTSPPYFGLRDYGTASWQGGDAACDHRKKNPEVDARTSTLGPNGMGLALDNTAYQHGKAFRATCGKCGATRVDQQIGLEPTVEAYVAQLVAVFREVRRVLRDDGVLFLNLGDSYASSGVQGPNSGLAALADKHAPRINPRNPNRDDVGDVPRATRTVPTGLKPKDLIGIPWRVAFALQADGWYLRSDIIWAKPNPMPESVRDRPTKAHEMIFLLTKSPRYFWDAEAVRESYTGHEAGIARRGDGIRSGEKGRQLADDHNYGETSFINGGFNHTGRNIRSVWTIATAPFAEAHFATFPPALAERCIKAGTSEKGACSACGAPWVRVVESERVITSKDVGQTNKDALVGIRDGNGRTSMARTGSSRAGNFSTETTGWQPTCVCFGELVEVEEGVDWITRETGERRTRLVYMAHDIPPAPAPCVVLDPFGGAGTVSLVAERLGRDSIYIDLSSDYAAMAKTRITGDAPMFTAVEDS